MVKNKYILLFTMLLGILSSCSIKENIQRDILIETTPTAINIPLITNITTATTLAEVDIAADLNTLISESTGQFSAADLKSVRITGFILEIEEEQIPDDGEAGEDEEVDLTNTFEAFDNITIQLKTQDGQLINIGNINNNSFTSSIFVQVPTTQAQDLKEAFTTGNFTYIITGVARNATTKIIKANVYSQYKLTLGT
jgi:hypothetical protein